MRCWHPRRVPARRNPSRCRRRPLSLRVRLPREALTGTSAAVTLVQVKRRRRSGVVAATTLSEAALLGAVWFGWRANNAGPASIEAPTSAVAPAPPVSNAAPAPSDSLAGAPAPAGAAAPAGASVETAPAAGPLPPAPSAVVRAAVPSGKPGAAPQLLGKCGGATPSRSSGGQGAGDESEGCAGPHLHAPDRTGLRAST